MSKRYFIIGANGQLGQALQALYPEAAAVDYQQFDMTDPAAYETVDWSQYDVIFNAAAMTNVDGAETPDGKKAAWAVNATAVGLLARTATEHGLTLVHVSSDYVFDGTQNPHREDEAFAPLGVYGQTKAAGDIATSITSKHYILRTSWVIGKGKNFILTMRNLAQRGIKPSVVNDQIGRLTFTDTLAAGIKHLVETKAPYGTYNLTNSGESVSWAEIAQLVYEKAGKSQEDVTGVSTAEYYMDKEGIALRPLQSTLALDKITATGFTPSDWKEEFTTYWNTLEDKE